ncbi:MAG: sulfur carrier protein ThiS [Alphaproteobacteria bacterium]
MNITVNGAPQNMADNLSLSNALKALDYLGKPAIAVALNTNFIPKENYAETFLKEGDALEILSPMQGG